MEYAPLGRSELRISRIGFGCAAIGGYDYGRVDDGESIAAVQRALDRGINFFDVADVYGLGRAERVLAQALGPRRHEVVIATKGGVGFDQSGRTWLDVSPAYLRKAVEASLRRLGLESIPLYQIHKPDDVTPIGDAVAALRRCQEEGKIQHIGCTRLSIAEIDEGQRAGRLESIQLPFSLLEQESGATFAYASREYGMSGVSYNSLGQGLLTGRYDRDSRFEGTDVRVRSDLFRGDAFQRGMATVERLRRVARARARTPGQVALRWVLQQPGMTCALSGAKRPAQVDENVGATDWSLTGDELGACMHSDPPGAPEPFC